MDSTLSSWAPRVLSILRIAAALTFISHGTQKLWGFPAAFPMPMDTLFTVAGWLEVVGGGLLLIGLFTRPVAFVLSGMMAVAFFMAHVSKGGIYPSLNGGEAAYLFCFIFLYLVFAGGGPWSVDAARRKG
ncbi:MAG: DoxX family protein [Caulobacter sp.]|jgi:putative oxidoreductase|nr:DoxX family protein [Caulobacter sp.]